MLFAGRSDHGSRSRDQRGAVAVEAALVVPLLMLILFGIVEMTLLLRDSTAVSSSVRVGSRLASAVASAGQGTCEASSNAPPCTPVQAPKLAQLAAGAIQKDGSAMPKKQIERLLVYRANSAGWPLPAGNTQLRCTSDCVTYVWDKDLYNAQTGENGKFRYQSGSWNTSQLSACVNSTVPPIDSVGVAMIARHPFLTTLFGSGMELQQHSVMQFEPLPQGQCAPGDHP